MDECEVLCCVLMSEAEHKCSPFIMMMMMMINVDDLTELLFEGLLSNVLLFAHEPFSQKP